MPTLHHCPLTEHPETVAVGSQTHLLMGVTSPLTITAARWKGSGLMLCPLVISTERDDHANAPVPRLNAMRGRCLFCGGSAGAQAEDERCCALCILVRHLERPCIDDELALAWLPELSQAALICLVRQLHTNLRAASEPLDHVSSPAALAPKRMSLHLARFALSSRIPEAASRLGTGKPSELGQALSRLPRDAYHRRHRLLGGLRVMPTGHFVSGSDDLYPVIVDSWIDAVEDAAKRDVRSAA